MSEIKRELGIGAGTLADKERGYTLEKQPPKLEFTCPICLDAVTKCQLIMCMGTWKEAEE